LAVAIASGPAYCKILSVYVNCLIEASLVFQNHAQIVQGHAEMVLIIEFPVKVGGMLMCCGCLGITPGCMECQS
jgi:hypothetical protein